MYCRHMSSLLFISLLTIIDASALVRFPTLTSPIFDQYASSIDCVAHIVNRYAHSEHIHKSAIFTVAFEQPTKKLSNLFVKFMMESYGYRWGIVTKNFHLRRARRTNVYRLRVWNYFIFINEPSEMELNLRWVRAFLILIEPWYISIIIVVWRRWLHGIRWLMFLCCCIRQ